MTFADQVLTVDRADDAVAVELGGISAEAHRSAEVAIGRALLQSLLAHPFSDQSNDWLRSLAEFGGRGLAYPGQVPRAFDARHLHAEANAEERNFALAGEFDRSDLSLAAALAEPARNEDAVQRLELGDDVRIGMLEQFGVNPLDVDLRAVGDAAMDQGLAQALIGIRETDIFADDADRDLAVVIVDPIHDVAPHGQFGRRRVGDAEGAKHLIVKSALVVLERHVVDVSCVERLDHRRLGHVAKEGDFFAIAVGDFLFGPAQ